MDILGFALLNGTLYGALLFMLAAGLTLIYGLMGVINFAHAGFYMLGAYFAYQCSVWWNFWAALVLVPLALAPLGLVMRRHLLSLLPRGDQLSQLLLTFGIAIAITELVQIVWGRLAVNYPIPAALNTPLFELGGLQFSGYRFFVLAVSTAVFVAIALVLRFSRVGLVLAAAQEQPGAVRALGYNTERLFDIVFGVGTAVAGIAGVLGGNLLGVYPVMGDQVAPLLFVIVVVGGLGSLSGAFVVSLAIGWIDTLATTYKVSLAPVVTALWGEPARGSLAEDLARMNSASLAPMLPYLMLVAVLLLSPRGLFGKREL